MSGNTMELGRKMSRRVPRLFLAVLALCLASGAALAFQYHPFGEVRPCVERITTVIPFGRFLRGLHYYSGHACALLILAHVLDHYVRRTYVRMRPRIWLEVCLGAGLGLAMLFSGFLLQGGKEGRFAGDVLTGLLELVPLGGAFLSRMVVGVDDAFYLPPYLHHCYVLPLLLFLLLKGHVRTWRPTWHDMVLAGLVFFPLAAWAPLPRTLSLDAVAGEVTGPWFFLGVQEALRHAPPLWAGLVLPGVLVVAFLTLPLLVRPWAGLARWFINLSAGVYALFAARLLLA